ncbi:hypothetical protein GN157_09000 [Flavobacterium rakeshii]|uniref:Uncharacterized protein n=1 Tax=Flavobacterium rakeshii TaxID=1038845 RepID=A0A6N8HBD0_9FLAO|nr:hypothetical protein [Flavobacterium rakeshii]MEE1897464.1 hypothetical protein [Flavobacterium rakeshii]MUV03844.1 hypothetical protein [Flavobacterium rakeshii]
MNHTKQQIREIAIKVLNDIENTFNVDKIENVFYIENEEIYEGVNKGKIMPCWGVSIIAICDNADYLTILDETGEPLYYQNFNTIIYGIDKDANGKYFIKDV